MNGKLLLALSAFFGAGLLLSKQGSAVPLDEPPAGDGDPPPKPKPPSAPKPKPPSIPSAVTVKGPSGNRYTVQRSSSKDPPTWIVRSEQFPGVFAIVASDLSILSSSNPSSELSLLEQDLDAIPSEAFR